MTRHGQVQYPLGPERATAHGRSPRRPDDRTNTRHSGIDFAAVTPATGENSVANAVENSAENSAENFVENAVYAGSRHVRPDSTPRRPRPVTVTIAARPEPDIEQRNP